MKWFKDGMEITKENSPHMTMFNYCKDENIDGSVHNFNKLVIEAPINYSDQGEYTVVISEDLKSSARLIIIDDKGDKYSQIQQQQTIQQQQERENVEFNKIYVKKSKLEGFQNLVPTANDNDMVYTETVMYQIEPRHQHSELTTIIESPDQRATISDSPKKHIKIVKQDEDLEFTKQLEPFTECDEGRDMVLECWTNKYDTYAEWFKDNKPLFGSPHGKYEISNQEGRKHRLVIKGSTPNDSGIYTCRINNFLQTNTILNVKEDKPLQIIRGLFDLHVPEFERNLELVVELNKRVQGDDQTYLIRWFVNRREVLSGNPDFETYCVDNKVILKYVREIIFDRDNNSQIEFRIQESKPGLHNPELATIGRIFVEKPKEQRFFTKKLDDSMHADSGLTLDLEVRTNFDAEYIKWSKNNQMIIPSPNFEFINQPHQRSYMLRIKNTRPKESGIYTVDVDGLQSSSDVKISDSPLKFVSKLKDQYYDLEHDTALTLDCQLNKPPSAFGLRPRWFKNDIEIPRSNQKYDMIEEHNICALIIYDLDERDEGKYSCQVGTGYFKKTTENI